MYLNFKSPSTWFILIVDAVILFFTILGLHGLIYAPTIIWTTSKPYFGILLSFVIISLLVGGQWAYWADHKDWNNGICKKNGKPWVCFDVDSQGGRGYKAGKHSIWISYPVDRRRK